MRGNAWVEAVMAGPERGKSGNFPSQNERNGIFCLIFELMSKKEEKENG